MNGFVSYAFDGDNLSIGEVAIPLIHSLPNGKFGTHPWVLVELSWRGRCGHAPVRSDN